MKISDTPFSKQPSSFTDPCQFIWKIWTTLLFGFSTPPPLKKGGSNYVHFIEIFKVNDLEQTFAVIGISFIHSLLLMDGNTKNKKSVLVAGKHLKLRVCSR